MFSIFVDVLLRNAVLTRVWVELAWTGAFWLMYFGSSRSIADALHPSKAYLDLTIAAVAGSVAVTAISPDALCDVSS